MRFDNSFKCLVPLSIWQQGTHYAQRFSKRCVPSKQTLYIGESWVDAISTIWNRLCVSQHAPLISARGCLCEKKLFNSARKDLERGVVEGSEERAVARLHLHSTYDYKYSTVRKKNLIIC